MNISIAGAKGRMGRRIAELVAQSSDLELGSLFDLPQFKGEEQAVTGVDGETRTYTLAGNATEALADADILIDFTLAESCLQNIIAASEASKAAVIGTTGFSDAQRGEIETLSKNIPIVLAPNMSVGVNLLFKLTTQVAATLGLDYNVEITEIHHNQKKDAPSGTAVRLAECAAEALDLKYAEDVAHGREGLVGERPRAEIGMHSLRGGDVVGEHTVHFVGQGERIELTHRAHNRDTFANGALVAARFAAKAEPGLYDMQDVLGLT